jgi:hypothetical protein
MLILLQNRKMSNTNYDPMSRLPSLATCKIVLWLIVPIVPAVAQSCKMTPTTTTTTKYVYRIQGFEASETNIVM